MEEKGPRKPVDIVIAPMFHSLPEDKALQEIREVPNIQGATGKGIWVTIGRFVAGLKEEVRYQKGRKHTARIEKAQVQQAAIEKQQELERKIRERDAKIVSLREQRNSAREEAQYLGKVTRRQFVAIFLGIAGVAYLEHEAIVNFLTGKREYFRDPEESPGSSEDQSRPLEERKPELFKRMTPYEIVLAEGLRYQDPKSGIWKDRLLAPFKVSEYLLGDKFVYTGIDENLTKRGGENVHTFAIMGDMSRRYGRNGNHREAYKTVTLPDAINNLLDYRRLSDASVRRWIVDTYNFSFGVRLDESLLKIDRDKSTKAITNVTYNLPPGFENELRLQVPKTVDDLIPAEKGGNITQVQKTLPLVGAGNRLLLHSGISPMHDLRVPASYMEADKDIPMLIPDGKWDIRTSDLAHCLTWYRNRKKQVGTKYVTGPVRGKQVSARSISAYLYENDPFARTLAEHVTRNAKTDAEKIQAITSFVQSLRYIWENDSDEDRPILITLFNDGSDCNNLVMAWISMMHYMQLDYYVIYTSDGKDENHTMGGIPEDTAPEELAARSRYKKILSIELTGKSPIGRVDPPSNHEIYALETFRFPKPGEKEPQENPSAKK